MITCNDNNHEESGRMQEKRSVGSGVMYTPCKCEKEAVPKRGQGVVKKVDDKRLQARVLFGCAFISSGEILFEAEACSDTLRGNNKHANL